MSASESKHTILIVDDAPENIMVLSAILGDDYEIVTADSGEEAMEIVRSDRTPDLILLDIVMAGMSGYEVCKQLKAEETTRQIPIIFVTSKDQDIDQVLGFKYGGVDFVTKPVSKPVIKARVQTQLELYDKIRMQRSVYRGFVTRPRGSK